LKSIAVRSQLKMLTNTQKFENLFDVELQLKVELKLMRRLIREQRTAMTSLKRAQQS